MTRLRDLALASCFALVLCAPWARAEDAPALDAKSTPDLLAQAEKLGAEDPRALARALSEFGSGDKETLADEVTFLVEYLVREPVRALRYVAVDRIAALDAEIAATRLTELADGADRDRTIFALEALSRLDEDDGIEQILPHVASRDLLIASHAVLAYGRLAGKKGAEELFMAALGSGSERVVDRAAWLVNDDVKKTAGVVSKLQKAAKKMGEKDSLAVKAAAVRLEDATIPPHKWPKKLGKATELVLAAPETVTLETRSQTYTDLLEKTLEYIKTELPGHHLMLCAGSKKIVMPSTEAARYVDFETDAIEVPASYAGQTPQQLSYHLVRSAAVLFLKNVGEPHRGERGWEPAIVDTYDVCVVAGLYDAGPGGLNRTRFVESILGKRPWDGN